MDLLTGDGRIYIIVLIILLILLGLGWYICYRRKQTRHQRHMKSTIEGLGLNFMRNVVLPDGLGGLVFIDYLLLIPNGVMVLHLENSSGYLFGGKNVDQWSQVLDHRTYKFNNPLYALEMKRQAVSWNLQQIDTDTKNPSPWEVTGWVVFSNAGTFPKGIPEQVSMIDDFVASITPITEQAEHILPQTLSTWQQLHEISVTTRADLQNNKPEASRD